MRGIHPRCGWVTKIGLKVFESAGDGEFVVAVEDEDVGHDVEARYIVRLLRNDPMHAFADGNDINDLHIAHVRFGGDMLLKHRP